MTISEKLKAVNDNIPKVYKAGQNDEWSTFWDSYQQNGAKTGYSYHFAGGWSEETFKPKYDIVAYNAPYMFVSFDSQTDLGEYMKGRGLNFTVKLTQYGSLSYAFLSSKFTGIPSLDMSQSTQTMYAVFANCYYLKKIDKIILSDTGTPTMSQWFQGCNELEEVRFGGKITCDMDIHWSTKLSAPSIDSIFTALSKDVTGKTITFPNTAKETYNNQYGEAVWNMTCANYSNWTVVLA